MAPLSGRNPGGSSELESWAEWGYGRQRHVLVPSPSRSHSAQWPPHQGTTQEQQTKTSGIRSQHNSFLPFRCFQGWQGALAGACCQVWRSKFESHNPQSGEENGFLWNGL